MFTLNCNGRLLIIDRPVVMGIINVTPDSFYTGSRQQKTDDILCQAEKMLQDGAGILDIGGQSTRPGSQPISAAEELQRVADPIAAISRRFPEAFISIDTFYGAVAREAVAAGAGIINDISAGTLDPELLPTVAALHVPYVLMHMQGTPAMMQAAPAYTNVTGEVLDFCIRRKEGLRQSGIADIIIDPGFGFGKTHAHNFQLLHHLDLFRMTGSPVLAGLSRKGTVYRTLGITAEEALNGTTVLNTIALLKGASILRVHDVREAVEAIRLVGVYTDAYKKEGE